MPGWWRTLVVIRRRRNSDSCLWWKRLHRLDHLIADAKSGVSGAGRKAEIGTLFSEASDNFKAYGASGPPSPAGNPAGTGARCGQGSGRDRPDLRAAPDADDSRHPCDALRP